jgi:hypothetical protein
MDQRNAVDRVRGMAAPLRTGEPPQILIDEWHQSIERSLLPLGVGEEEGRDCGSRLFVSTAGRRLGPGWRFPGADGVFHGRGHRPAGPESILRPMEPADLAAAIERDAGPLAGPADRFRGYGVLGLVFASGDLLAMRRFPSSSHESAHTSVWHRAVNGRWTLYADLGGDRGCARYFGSAIDEIAVTPIRVEWVSAHRLTISIDGGRLLHWSICLAASSRSHVITAVAPTIPAWCWNNTRARVALEALISTTFRLGRFHLAGRTPSGHSFRLRLQAVWHIQASRARFCGRELGALSSLDPQVALADFWIPRQGLFVVGDIEMSKMPPSPEAPRR